MFLWSRKCGKLDLKELISVLSTLTKSRVGKVTMNDEKLWCGRSGYERDRLQEEWRVSRCRGFTAHQKAGPQAVFALPPSSKKKRK